MSAESTTTDAPGIRTETGAEAAVGAPGTVDPLMVMMFVATDRKERQAIIRALQLVLAALHEAERIADA